MSTNRDKARIDRSRLGLDKVPNTTPVPLSDFRVLKEEYDHHENEDNPHNINRKKLQIATYNRYHRIILENETITKYAKSGSSKTIKKPTFFTLDNTVAEELPTYVADNDNDTEYEGKFKGATVFSNIKLLSSDPNDPRGNTYTDTTNNRRIASVALVSEVKLYAQYLRDLSAAELSNHVGNNENPHKVIRKQLGLSTCYYSISNTGDTNPKTIENVITADPDSSKLSDLESYISIFGVKDHEKNPVVSSDPDHNSHKIIASTALTHALYNLIQLVQTAIRNHATAEGNVHNLQLPDLNIKWLDTLPNYSSQSFPNAFYDQKEWPWIDDTSDPNYNKNNKATSGFWFKDESGIIRFKYGNTNADNNIVENYNDYLDNPGLLNNQNILATTKLTYELYSKTYEIINNHVKRTDNPHRVKIAQTGFLVLSNLTDVQDALDNNFGYDNPGEIAAHYNNTSWSLSGYVASNFVQSGGTEAGPFNDTSIDTVNPIHFGGSIEGDNFSGTTITSEEEKSRGLPNLTLLEEVYKYLTTEMRKINPYALMPEGTIMLYHKHNMSNEFVNSECDELNATLPKWSTIKWVLCDGKQYTFNNKNYYTPNFVNRVPKSTGRRMENWPNFEVSTFSVSQANITSQVQGNLGGGNKYIRIESKNLPRATSHSNIKKQRRNTGNWARRTYVNHGANGEDTRGLIGFNPDEWNSEAINIENPYVYTNFIIAIPKNATLVN